MKLKDELDIVIEKAKELLNDKESILEELKKHEINYDVKKHIAKSHIECGSYILEMQIKRIEE